VAQFFELVEKRSEHEALKQVLMAHGRCLLDCGCWHNDAHGVRHLKERLAHMWQLADRLEDTLGKIQQIEAAVFSRSVV
jgi:hypothetical protein